MVSRRDALKLGLVAGGLAAGAAPLAWSARPLRVRDHTVIAKPARLELLGPDYPSTEVWAFNNMIPGPVLRAVQGDTIRVRFRNRLPMVSTIHWHGIRLPNAMDGVPGITQPPVKPGEDFQYEFALPDAGTFWYHPHVATDRPRPVWHDCGRGT